MNATVALGSLIRESNIGERKIKELQEKLSIREKSLTTKISVKEILTQILYFKKQEIKVIQDIVNAGLEYAYPERDLNFRIEFVEKFNKIVPEFYLNELQLKSPFVGDGGGIISMIGLLLYITFIKLKNIKIVLLDEVEAMVDINASNKLFQFLNVFAEDNGINIIAITHKQFGYQYHMITDKIKLLKVGD